jgi:hypothetical protein
MFMAKLLYFRNADKSNLLTENKKITILNANKN